MDSRWTREDLGGTWEGPGRDSGVDQGWLAHRKTPLARRKTPLAHSERTAKALRKHSENTAQASAGSPNFFFQSFFFWHYLEPVREYKRWPTFGQAQIIIRPRPADGFLFPIARLLWVALRNSRGK